ncbi:hypothetical protein [Streptomyces rishiriensis]|uniref:hypothetical protein n=1 Tax=Streptomyces rishiriensis TaxID=68264 RepID=UPI00131EF9FA|nr:hypothetical protein [Streptomyces rishiriensis]
MAVEPQIDQGDVDDEHVGGSHHPERALGDVLARRTVVRWPAGTVLRATGVRAVMAVMAERVPAAERRMPTEAPAVAVEAATVTAVTTEAAATVAVSAAGMVPQLFPGSQGFRATSVE